MQGFLRCVWPPGMDFELFLLTKRKKKNSSHNSGEMNT